MLLHLGIAGAVIVGVVAYLVLIARPLLDGISLSRSVRQASQRFAGGSSRFARVFTRLERALGIAAAAYLVIVSLGFTLYEWYNNELGDQQEMLATMFRILIGFAQVIGNLSGIRLAWPPEFYTMASWFDFAKFSFDVPSVACAIEQASVGYTFYSRHLLYTIGPLVLIVLLALPSVWARLRRLPAAIIADLDDRRLRWTLFAVFVLYPKVSALRRTHCDALSSAAQCLRLCAVTHWSDPSDPCAGLADRNLGAHLQERWDRVAAGAPAPVRQPRRLPLR